MMIVLVIVLLGMLLLMGNVSNALLDVLYVLAQLIVHHVVVIIP